ncbi:MAG: hypothetical protein KDB80_11865 [Planctomycetes bacterium]|nr:hypothetical protein [Planctomycetota bacterium]
MRLQAELAAVVLGYVAMNLLLVFAAIGLFVRMGPAIEGILLRNDATIVAAEDVLEVLARTSTSTVDTLDRERIAAALTRASNNITESGEAPVIVSIEANVEPALEGDAEARTALVSDLRSLIAINRNAMRAVDEEAQRLGSAGAWAAAFVGFVSLGLCLLLGRNLGNRIVRPILELRQVLAAAHGGDRFRRCAIQRAPAELCESLAGVNQLLDARSLALGDESDEPAVSRPEPSGRA